MYIGPNQVNYNKSTSFIQRETYEPLKYKTLFEKCFDLIHTFCYFEKQLLFHLQYV